MKMMIGSVLLMLLGCGIAFGGDAPSPTRTFRNPLLENGEDPWFVFHNGQYYYCKSTGNEIEVAISEDFTRFDKAKYHKVWTPPTGTAWSHNLWAPELHYLDGAWYIYVAADDGDNRHHRMYVLKGTSQNPCDPFLFIGKIAAPSDTWAIDGTVLEWKGIRYFVWSGWEDDSGGGQNLYIAPMSDPATISGKRVRISKPEYGWEHRGSEYGGFSVNEGPVALSRNGTLHIVYSASGSWCDDYCLGLLTLRGNNPLNPSHWKKTPRPIFKKTATLFGPGHCCFIPAADGKEVWCIYHANRVSGSGWRARSVLAQKIGWDHANRPILGVPVGFGVDIPY